MLALFSCLDSFSWLPLTESATVLLLLIHLCSALSVLLGIGWNESFQNTKPGSNDHQSTAAYWPSETSVQTAMLDSVSPTYERPLFPGLPLSHKTILQWEVDRLLYKEYITHFKINTCLFIHFDFLYWLFKKGRLNLIFSIKLWDALGNWIKSCEACDFC